MLPLKERQKDREHRKAVNSGEIKDSKATHGTDESGAVIGDDGKPVAGTAPGGAGAEGDGKAGTETTSQEEDFSKMTTAELDKAIVGRAKPTGWDEMNLAAKREAIASAPKVPGWN